MIRDALAGSTRPGWHTYSRVAKAQDMRPWLPAIRPQPTVSSFAVWWKFAIRDDPGSAPSRESPRPTLRIAPGNRPDARRLDKRSAERNSPGENRERMKRVSKGEEAAVAVPPVLADIEVEVLFGVVPREVRAVRVADAVPPDGSVRSAICATAHRLLSGLHRIRDLKSTSASYQVASFLRNTDGALA